MADTLREALESARDGFINLRPAWDENPGMRRQMDAHIKRIDAALAHPPESSAPVSSSKTDEWANRSQFSAYAWGLRSESAEEAQDAARYRRLCEGVEFGDWGVVQIEVVDKFGGTKYHQLDDKAELDAAIDAAMAEKGKQSP